MFIKQVPFTPRYVDGNRFYEKILKGKYKGYDLTHTTILMNDKPIIKSLDISGPNLLKHLWKSVSKSKLDYKV